MIPTKNKDLRWYFNLEDTHQRKMKGFDTLAGTSSLNAELALLDVVLPRTCGEAGQGTKEWFLDRMFSGTSSQIHHLVVAAAPFLSNDPSVASDLKDALCDILKYTHQERAGETVPGTTDATQTQTQAPSPSPLTAASIPTSPPAAARISTSSPLVAAPSSTSPQVAAASTSSLPTTMQLLPPAIAPSVTSPTTATATATAPTQPPAEEEESDENEAAKSDDQIQAEDWVERLTTPDTDDGDDDFKNHLKNLSRSTISWIYWILSGSTGPFRESPRASTEKKLLEWIQKSRNERPYFLQKKALLLEIAKAKKQKANMQNSKEELIKKILKGIEDEKNNTSSGNENNTNQDGTNNTTDIELTPLAAILRFSFLRPQKQMSERRAARVGQKNEKKFLLQFWELVESSGFNVPDKNNPTNLKVIYRPGLVCRKGDDSTFVKDSADGVVVFVGDVSACVVEVLFFVFFVQCMNLPCAPSLMKV